MEALGNKIAAYRQNCGFTQEELALRIGVTPQAVSKWERNQSLPDLPILADLCRVLKISADFLLGVESKQLTENNDTAVQDEILKKLRCSLEPLALYFDKNLVESVMNHPIQEYVSEQRKLLAAEGILMPLVRIMDWSDLTPNEFVILSYDRILYKETIDTIDADTCRYMADRLADTVRDRYGDILNRDIVKTLTDNLKVKYPATIEGIVPEKISYGLLQDVLKELLAQGNSPRYLLKIVEIMDSALREKPGLSAEELTKLIAEKLKTKDSFWGYIQTKGIDQQNCI